MSYTYLQEQGEESSVDNFQDIPAYVLSRLKSTQEKYCSKDSETESCQNSPSGTISTPLMENRGKEESISFAEGFLVRTFLQQEKELASRANALGFGERWHGWLAKYDQDLSLWKTPQCSLLEDYIEFSETWPKWGMMHDGACWELMTSVLHTEGRESGYWHIPTPTCSDAFTSNLRSTQQSDNSMHSVSLAQLCEKMPEKMWPTPRSRDWKDGDSVPPSRQNKPGLATLGQRVAMDKNSKMKYPTLRASDYKDSYNCDRGKGSMDDGHLPIVIFREHKFSYPTPGTTGMSNGSGNCEKANKLHESGQISEEERKSMRAGNGGQLNPDWVEWLMGWPIKWTALEPIELDWRDWDIDPAENNEIPRVSQSITNRVPRLKAIGNGQVPAVAATAWKILSECLL